MDYKKLNVEKEMIPFKKILKKHNYTEERLLDSIENLLKMKKEENLYKLKKIEFVDMFLEIIQGFKVDITDDRITDNQYLSILVLSKCMVREMMIKKN